MVTGFKKKVLKIIYKFTKKCLLISMFSSFFILGLFTLTSTILISPIVINAVRKYKIMMYIMYKYIGKMRVLYLKVPIFCSVMVFIQ